MAFDEDYVADDQLGSDQSEDSNKEDHFANDYPDEDEYYSEDGERRQGYKSDRSQDAEWDLTIPRSKFYQEGTTVKSRELPLEKFLKQQYEEEQAIKAYQKAVYRPQYNYFVEEDEDQKSDDY